jgi:hypothetical protein
MPRRGFCCATARAAARGVFLVFAEKTGKYRRSQPCSFRKAKAGIRPDGRADRSIGQPCWRKSCYPQRVESIAGKLIELAERGDMRAIRVCMDRLAPVIKHQPIAVELPPIEKPADSVEAVASIAAAVAAGELTATEAAQLAKVVDVYVRALDSKGFDQRLSKLEKGISDVPAVPAHGAVRDDATA